MAAKAEVLTGTAIAASNKSHKRPSLTRRFAVGFADWVRRGQLGSSAYTEMGRYTGGRI